ncbi:GNAT family acetyltransferase [Prosthecomicrobium hirschii]|uniref:GNAT family acetyltransferase n=1 Tax=Prosthecodimorpha hirschii TaxID=665126 RepID=UPI00221E9538|nr:GNAT family acetyltransferase [Prosthecomicrobium hirschii]
MSEPHPDSADAVRIAIRPVEDGDVAAVIDLWHRAGLYRPWNPPERDIDFARRSPHCALLVADVDGRPVTASVMVGEDGHRGWVYYLAVDPSVQGRGLGRRMMAAAEAWLLARGIWKVQLLVRRENGAVRGFYDALGFETGDVVMMQKWLEPR